MSEKPPKGWTCVGGDHWRHINEATADMHRPHGLWRAAVYGPDRQSKGEAAIDRLNMIAGLEGRPSAALDEALALIESMVVERNELLHAADLAAERIDAAQKKIAAMEERAEKYEASPDRASARMDAVVEKLDALGVPFCGGLVERIEALADRSADKDALIKLGVELRSVRTERDNLRSNAAFTSSCIDNARALRVERDAAMAKVQELETRRAGDRAEHAALILEIGKALNANPTTWGFPPGCVPEEFPRFIRERGRMLQSARSERDDLRKEVAMLKEERDRMVDDMTALEEDRDAALAKVDALSKASDTLLKRSAEQIEAMASERDAALAKVADLNVEVKTLTEAREYLERNIGELEDRRDADEAHVADLALSEARLGHDAAEKALAEKTRNFRTAISAVQRLRVERDNLRHTIATQQARIDGLTAAACDVAPQLLRDSMRVTQEENARLRAEVSALTAKVITFEAYIARHHDANARTVQERNTCMERMELLRSDLAKVTGERDALLKERPAHRLAGVFAMQDQLVKAAENAERLTAEIAALTTRATAAEGYAQHLLAALNAVSGFRGMP